VWANPDKNYKDCILEGIYNNYKDCILEGIYNNYKDCILEGIGSVLFL